MFDQITITNTSPSHYTCDFSGPCPAAKIAFELRGFFAFLVFMGIKLEYFFQVYFFH
jgi:hypothetical protein